MSDVASAHRMLAEIAASSNDAIVGKDLDGIVTSWNAAAELLFGFSAAEMVGQSITRIIPAERADEEPKILERIRRGERMSHFDTERRTGDGRTIPVSVTLSPIRAEDGRIVGVFKTARDLSGPRRLSDELRQRGALLQAILDTVPDALVVIDRHGIVQAFSRAAVRMFGYGEAEMIGRNVSLLMPAAHAAGHDGYLQRYLATGERRIIGIGRVVAGRRKDGTAFPMELQVGEVDVPGSHLFAGFVRDLTERQTHERRLSELQSELIHVSRLSELGQMVSAIAHEVSQPLTAIANYLGGIRRLLAPGTAPDLRGAVDKAIAQATRADGILRSLRGLVRKEIRPREVCNLETVIQEASALALLGTSRSVDFKSQVAPDAVLATIDKVQIQQVLLNLLRNAVQAMAGSPLREMRVTACKIGDRVEIRVADSGPGLAEAVQARLFQPFVTTKPDGLGVGLSICQAIVQAHGGELAAEAGASGGTVFVFTLPGA